MFILVAILATYGARKITKDASEIKFARRLLQTYLFCTLLTYVVTEYRRPATFEPAYSFIVTSLTVSIVFAALYVFKGDASELKHDVLKTVLYIVGSASLFLAIWTVSYPFESTSFVLPGSKPDSASTYFANSGATISFAMGMILVYAAASGDTHERRRAGQSMLITVTYLLVSEGMSGHISTSTPRAYILGVHVLLLITALYGVKSEIETAKLVDTHHHSNIVVRGTLMIVTVLGLILVVAHTSMPDRAIHTFYPEVGANVSEIAQLSNRYFIGMELGVATVAAYASRQGSVHEQRRVAQALLLGLILHAAAEYKFPINGVVSMARLLSDLLLAGALIVGLYVLERVQPQSSSEAASTKKTEKVEKAETPRKAETPKKKAAEEPTTPRGRGRPSGSATPKASRGRSPARVKKE
jgi:hypothetical protein